MVLECRNAIVGAAEVLTFGKHKYARGNWKLGFPASEVVDSLGRHLLALMDGESRDPETGLLHVDHITVNALFLAEMARRPERNDIYKLEDHDNVQLDRRCDEEQGRTPSLAGCTAGGQDPRKEDRSSR